MASLQQDNAHLPTHTAPRDITAQVRHAIVVAMMAGSYYRYHWAQMVYPAAWWEEKPSYEPDGWATGWNKALGHNLGPGGAGTMRYHRTCLGRSTCPPHLDMCDRDWAHLHQVTTVQMHSFPCSLLPTASDPAGSGAALTAGSRCSTWWQGNSNCPLPCFESHNPILCLIIPRDSTPHSFLTLFTGTHWQSPVVLDGAQLIYIRICPILPYNLFHWFFKSPIWNLSRPQNVCKVTG